MIATTYLKKLSKFNESFFSVMIDASEAQSLFHK